MGKLDEDGGKRFQLTRRQFLKAGAATAAVGAAGIDFAAKASSAVAAEVAETYHTTCPYCSASCGQLIDVDAAGNVLDIYGDHMSPFNDGGLCAKGAGTFQLVNNARRLGAFAGPHPENNVFAYDDTYADGVAYKRTGNGAWEKVELDVAMNDIAAKMVAARGPITAPGQNPKGVAFFGSSHMNNEQNYSYRRLIAQFGTSNVEHQARI
jgi:formate dehydrogenase major subunit